jgi:hypothetical protein
MFPASKDPCLPPLALIAPQMKIARCLEYAKIMEYVNVILGGAALIVGN